MHIGRELRARRELAGLTQEDVAGRCGVTRQAVSLWESLPRLRPAAVRLYCMALGVQPQDAWLRGRKG